MGFVFAEGGNGALIWYFSGVRPFHSRYIYNVAIWYLGHGSRQQHLGHSFRSVLRQYCNRRCLPDLPPLLRLPRSVRRTCIRTSRWHLHGSICCHPRVGVAHSRCPITTILHAHSRKASCRGSTRGQRHLRYCRCTNQRRQPRLLQPLSSTKHHCGGHSKTHRCRSRHYRQAEDQPIRQR